jgi:hypothetical protein
VEALSSAMAAFGRSVRMGIEEMDELDDKDAADILTEVSRGIDKWVWFVEAHQQGEPTDVEVERPAPRSADAGDAKTTTQVNGRQKRARSAARR